MWVLHSLQAGPSGGREACLLPLTFPEPGVGARTWGQGWRCCWSARWPTQLGSAGPSPSKAFVALCPTHTCQVWWQQHLLGRHGQGPDTRLSYC